MFNIFMLIFSIFQAGKEDESGGCLLDIWSPLRDFQEGEKKN